MGGNGGPMTSSARLSTARLPVLLTLTVSRKKGKEYEGQ